MTTVQRRLISLAILLPGAAIAWALGSWFQQHREQTSQAAAAANKMWHCQQGVVAMAIERGNTALNLARRLAPTDEPNLSLPWRLEHPLPASGDDDTIGAVVEAACDLPAMGSIVSKAGEPPLSLPDFGLAPPRAKLTLTYADGRSEAVAIGDKSVFDGTLYVQAIAAGADAAPAAAAAAATAGGNASLPAADAPVQRVDGGFSFQVERDAFSLRDKRLLPANGAPFAAVAVFEAAAGSPNALRPTYVLRRQGERFVLADGEAAAGNGNAGQAAELLADGQEARALLDQLANLRASKFVDDAPTPAGLARFGLAKPQLMLRLRTSEQADGQSLRLGTIKLGEAVHTFAQAGEANAPIAELAADSLLETLRHGRTKLRDMHLLHVAADEVATLDVHADDANLSLRRVAARDGAGPPEWQLGEDANSRATLDQARIRGLVFRLANLRADTLSTEPATESAMAAAKLGAPAFVVRLADAAGKPLGTLRLGAAAAERRPAQADDGPIGQIFAGAIDGLSARAEDFAVAAERGDSAPPAPL